MSQTNTPSYRMHVSERGNPLLYVGAPLDVPVLTLENYTKWYEPYLLMSDGSVQKVEIEDIQKVQDQHPDALWVDHLFHPRLLQRLANLLGAELDERAEEVATGRWVLEYHTSKPFESSQFYPPKEG